MDSSPPPSPPVPAEKKQKHLAPQSPPPPPSPSELSCSLILSLIAKSLNRPPLTPTFPHTPHLTTTFDYLDNHATLSPHVRLDDVFACEPNRKALTLTRKATDSLSKYVAAAVKYDCEQRDSEQHDSEEHTAPHSHSCPAFLQLVTPFLSPYTAPTSQHPISAYLFLVLSLYHSLSTRTPLADIGTPALLATHLSSLSTLPPLPRPCGYVFKHGDIAWNCRSCQSDPTCVQCDSCFNQSDHTGHDVLFHRTTPGGCCDCGDVEAWDIGGCCKKHRPHEAPSNTTNVPDIATSFNASSQLALSLPPPTRALLATLSTAILTSAAAAQSTPAHGCDLTHFLYDIPLTFAKVTLDCAHAPNRVGYAWTAFERKYGEDIKSCRNLPTPMCVRPENKLPPSHDPDSFPFPADPASLLSTLSALPPAPASPAPPFAPISPPLPLLLVRVHNDDVHTYSDVSTALTGHPNGVSSSLADKLTEEIDKTGEAIVLTTPEFEKALKTFLHLKQRGLHVSVVTTYAPKHEAIATSSLTFLNEMAETNPALQALVINPLLDVSTRHVRQPFADVIGAPVPPVPPYSPSPMYSQYLEMGFGAPDVGFNVVSPHALWAVTLERRDPSDLKSKFVRCVTDTFDGPMCEPDIITTCPLLRDLQHFTTPPSQAAQPGEPLFNFDVLYDSSPAYRRSIDNIRASAAFPKYQRFVTPPDSSAPPPPSSPTFSVPWCPLLLLLLLDPYPPNHLRKAIHNTFLPLLTDSRFKNRFGASLAIAYKSLSYLFCAGVGTARDSIFSINVQIFTSGSVAKFLSTSKSSLSLLLSNDNPNLPVPPSVDAVTLPLPCVVVDVMHATLLGCSSALARKDIKKVGFERYSGASSVQASLLPGLPGAPPFALGDGYLAAPTVSHQRINHLLKDLEYVFQTPETSTLTLANVDSDFALRWTRFLRLTQHNDAIHRQTGAHVQYDNNRWNESYPLSIATSASGEALTSNAELPSLRRLFALLVKNIKLWVYRDGLPPLLEDNVHLEALSWERYKKKHVSVTNLQSPSSVYLTLSPDGKTRKFSTPVMPKQFSKKVEIREEAISAWMDDPHPNPPLRPLFLADFEVDHAPLNPSAPPISFYLPLHRNLAQTLAALVSLPESSDPALLHSFFADPSHSLGDPGDVTFPSCPPSDPLTLFFAGNIAAAKTVHAIADFPLRTIVAWRQIAEYRMWAKNGHTAQIIATYYASFPNCKHFRDLDLLLLQFSAASVNYGLGPDQLFDLMVDRFSLKGFVDTLLMLPSSLTFFHSITSRIPDPIYAENMCCAFFSTLNMLVSELPPPPEDRVANVKRTARRDLLHKLCLAPMTHSECFTSALSNVSSEGDAPPFFQAVFEEIMKEITVDVPPSRTFSMVRYDLKDSLSLEYDPCFFHLSQKEHQTAMETVAKKRLKFLKKNVAPLVVPLDDAHSMFASARNLLSVKSAFTAVRRTLLFVVLGGNWRPVDNKSIEESTLVGSQSVLEVLEFLTLQMQHALDTGTAAAVLEMYTDDTAKVMQKASAGVTSSPVARSSILHSLVTLFEHWSKSSESAEETEEDEGEGGQASSSGARYLTLSGLTWLIRVVSLLSSGDECSSDELRSRAAGGVGPTSGCVLSGFPTCGPILWPAKETTEIKDAAPDSAAKQRQKQAQAKAMASMKARQAAFQSTIDPEDEGDQGDKEDDCIICRCSSDTPTGAIAHVQRSRLLHHQNLASQHPSFTKIYRVVGENGCQMRDSVDLASPKKGWVKVGCYVELVRSANEDPENPLINRRVYVREVGGDNEGWASIESQQKYRILFPVSSDVGKWGSTRPLVKFCGHFAHLHCIEKHTLMLHQKSVDRMNYVGMHCCDLTKGEFLCPACTLISNCVVPALVSMPDERCEQPTEKDLEILNASKTYQLAMVDSMEASFAPRLRGAWDSSLGVQSSAKLWDHPSLKAHRALLISFAALSSGAAMLVANFEFGAQQIQELRLLAGGSKALINAAHTYGGKDSPLEMLRSIVSRVSPHGRFAGVPMEEMGDCMTRFLSSMPVHLANDGQLKAPARARATLSAAFWNPSAVNEYSPALTSEVFAAPIELQDASTVPSIPVPFAANAGVEAGALALQALARTDGKSPACVWPVLGVLSWDLAILSSVVTCSFEHTTENGDFEELFFSLMLARIVQIVLFDLNERGDEETVAGDVGELGQIRHNILLEFWGQAKLRPSPVTEGEISEALNERLLPYLKIFVLVARASERSSKGFAQSFLANDELLECEDLAEFFESLPPTMSLASAMNEGGNWARTCDWIKELVIADKAHSDVALLEREEEEKEEGGEEVDVSVMQLDEVEQYAAGVAGGEAAGAGGEDEGEEDWVEDPAEMDADVEATDADGAQHVLDEFQRITANAATGPDAAMQALHMLEEAVNNGQIRPADAVGLTEAMEAILNGNPGPSAALHPPPTGWTPAQQQLEGAGGDARGVAGGEALERDIQAHKSASFAHVSRQRIVDIGWHSMSGYGKIRGGTVVQASRDIHPCIRDVSHGSSVMTGLDYDPFIKLPTNFIDLYHYAVSVMKGCAKEGGGGGGEEDHAAVCLLTGAVLPIARTGKDNKDPGNCTAHARKHNSGVGIYFLVSKASVLLISDKHACYWKSLYLDMHGEEDIGLRRGRPLTLSEGRLRELKAMYLAHGVVRCIAAARQNSDRVIREAWY